MLDAEPFVPSAPPGGLNFVGDEIAAILLHDAESYLEIFFWWRDKAAHALNRLGKESSNATRSRKLNDIFKVLHACYFAVRIFQPKRAAITIWIHSMDNSDFDRAPPPRVHAGEAAGQRGAAAVTVPQGNNFEVPGVHARYLDGSFIGLGSTIRKIRFLEGSRRDLCQFFRQRDHRLIRKTGGHMLHAVDLLLGA